MPHTTIDATGAVVYRTKLMEAERAAAYARMIGANETRFCAVKIVASTGKTARYFVEFRPVNIQRQADLYEVEYNKNVARAASEGADYIYWKDTDKPLLTWVFNPRSGETYEMWQGRCACPQKRFRLERAAMHCKHELEMDNRLAAGINPYGTEKQTPAAPVPLPAPKRTLEERFAAAGLRPDLDF